MGHAETFEHTADLGLRVVGDDLADLFQTAATGLFDVIVANREVDPHAGNRAGRADRRFHRRLASAVA